MDDYLSSLVKVEENSEPEVPVVADVIQPSESDVTEVAEEVTKEDTVVVEENIEPAKATVKVEKPKKDESDLKPEKKESKSSKTKTESKTLEEGKGYTVDLVRVYNTPDTHQVSKTISGKIVFLGKIGTFSIISYMKHGFGLVKGNVNNLESAIDN